MVYNQLFIVRCVHEIIHKFEPQSSALQEERKRRSEELQAKEDAVQERKMAIEADRLARIAYIQDKITESQAKVRCYNPMFCAR